jgi:uncharacterized protein (DUF952 family)
MTMPAQAPEFIFKVAPAELVVAAQDSGNFTGMPIDDRDGFIHLSTAAQLRETLALHFRGQDHLVLLAVRADDVEGTLRWEPSRGGQLFPHVYGDLPMSAVAWTAPIVVADDGACVLPEGVR